MRFFRCFLMVTGAVIFVASSIGFISFLRSDNKTLVTPAEIYIQRMSLGLTITTYSIDRKRGTEEISISRLGGAYESVDYDKKCECVTSYYVAFSFSIRKYDDGTFRYSGKEVSSVEITPEEARPYLEKGLAIRDKTKIRFASILKEAQYE
ncbi:MAG: hypothetical protein Q8O83_03025 [bacterium]|nr:hypothetical protein [bacterium]